MSDIFYQRVCISDDAVTQEVEGEMVILDMQRENYFGLDVIGTRVWELLEKHGNLNEVVAIMLNEFEVEEAQLKTDLQELLSRLIDAGLVSVED